jgi:integrase
MRRGDGLYERGKGKLTTWYLDCVVNGVRYQKRLGRGITRSVAGELARVERAAILKAEAGIGGQKRKDLSFKDAAKKFLAWAAAEKRPHTLRYYRQCLGQLEQTFGEKRLGEITPWALEAYRKRRSDGRQLTERPEGVSDAEWQRRCRQAGRGAGIRVNRELACLRALMNRCRDWGLYNGDTNPVLKVKFRKETKARVRWLEPDEESRLLAALPSATLRALVQVGIHTGLRIAAEALTLKWSSVDVMRGVLTVEAAYSKNHRMRVIPLNSVALGLLKALKTTATSDFVFVNENGQPYTTIRPMMRRACQRAGLAGVSPHVLRHTFASRLVMAGVDLRTVQELGGWASLSMVERYSHLSPSHKAKAVEQIAAAFPYVIHYAQKEVVAAVR